MDRIEYPELVLGVCRIYVLRISQCWIFATLQP